MSDNKFTRIKGVSDHRRLPRLGKIRLGIKVKKPKPDSRCKHPQDEMCGYCSYPKEVPHFVVPREVAAIYGNEPLELDIMFPIEDERQVFPQAYRWYQQSGLRCKGNGETAMRRVADIKAGNVKPIAPLATDADPNSLAEVECPCPLLESGDCGQSAHLMVLLPKVSLGGVYQIATGSFHNIVRLNSCIDYARSMAGRIALVPLKLIRQKEEIEFEGKKAPHYLLQAVLDVTLEDVAQLRSDARSVLLRTEKLALPAPADDEIVVGEEGAKPEPKSVVVSVGAGGDDAAKFEEAINICGSTADLDKLWLQMFATKEFKQLPPETKGRLSTVKITREKILEKTVNA